MPEIFISSCSRRQLARRRPSRGALRLQLLFSAVLIAVALGAVIAVHGGV